MLFEVFMFKEISRLFNLSASILYKIGEYLEVFCKKFFHINTFHSQSKSNGEVRLSSEEDV